MKNTGAGLIGSKDRIIGVICEDQEGLEYGVYLPAESFESLLDEQGVATETGEDLNRIEAQLQKFAGKQVQVLVWEK